MATSPEPVVAVPRRYFADTSFLLRCLNTKDVRHPVARRTVRRLHRAGAVVHVAPQVLIELHNVLTRPLDKNGLGLSVAQAAHILSRAEIYFPLLPDTADIFPAWKRLIQVAGVSGKQVHDARLACVCQVHQVSHILTFNVADFKRYEPHLPGFTVVDPAQG